MGRMWWKESVVYQIYPRSFKDSNGDGIGDLNGVTEKLDYLKELGVDVLWLSPICQSPNDDNGYDISDYRAIMDEFGTMEDFDRLLAETHKRGLKLLFDLVVNHTSDEHKWFQESRKSKDNPYRDYYFWRPAKEGKEPNNWGASFGGSAWEYDELTEEYYLHLFSKKQPDLNWDNKKVREEVYDLMRFWLDKGVDGFRMDVINLISKEPALPDGPAEHGGYGYFGTHVANGPHVHEYLQEMRREVLAKYDTMTVGETAAVNIEEALKYASDDEKELNMIFQFEHMELDGGEKHKWNQKKIPFVRLKEVLSRWQVRLSGRAWNSLYFNNHDQPRSVSRLGNDGIYREKSAKMLATCLHMMQGTPYIYQGEELGMTNAPFEQVSDFRDIESIHAFEELTERGTMKKNEMMGYLRYKSRDNARTPMQWDSSENAGFSEAKPWIMVNPNYTEINAEEQLTRETSVFHYYKKLIALRKKYPVIVYGDYELLYPESESLFVYKRKLKEDELLVICNFMVEETEIVLPKPFENGSILISNAERDVVSKRFMLSPYEALVLKK